MKWLLFHAPINHQFKTSELENLEKLVEKIVQTLKSCLMNCQGEFLCGL